MMTMFRVSARALSLGLSSLALAGVLLGCASALKKPDVAVSDVRVAGFESESVQLTVSLRVHNPNAIEIDLSELKAKFWIADTEAGELEASQPKYLLTPNSTVMLPLKINVPAKALPTLVQRSVLALIQGGLSYRVQGSVATSNGLMTIPFEKSGEIGKRL